MNYNGNNRRGRIAIPAHAHPLVRQFIAEMNKQQATYAELAARTKVGVDTMRYWPKRHIPRLDTFEAALNALGLKLVIRRIEEPIPKALSPKQIARQLREHRLWQRAKDMAANAP
jgi:hypothetical protein